MDAKKLITIYTDGSSLGNPGPGGYGAVLLFGEYRKEISGGYRMTTNNRMEIKAAIEALKAIKGSPADYKVVIYTDSRLLVDTFHKHWIETWIAKNWRKSNKEKVLNKDLLEELHLLTKKFEVKFEWVEAHVGIPENERCDELGKAAAARSADHEIDSNYENNSVT